MRELRSQLFQMETSLRRVEKKIPGLLICSNLGPNLASAHLRQSLTFNLRRKALNKIKCLKYLVTGYCPKE